MLFVCSPKIMHRHCFQFLLEVKNLLPQEKLKTMLMQNFGVKNKEHYGMFSVFFFCKFERIECVKDVGCCSSSSN